MEINKKSYNAIASVWHSIQANKQVTSPIIDFANKLNKNSHILDIGCGTGLPIHPYLNAMGHTITGIDIAENMLFIASSVDNPNNYILANIMDYETDNTFDGIVAWDVLFHVNANHHFEIFSKLYNLLNEKGYLLCTLGLTDNEHFDDMLGHRFYYSSLEASKVINHLLTLKFNIIRNIQKFEEKTESRDWVLMLQK